MQNPDDRLEFYVNHVRRNTIPYSPISSNRVSYYNSPSQNFFFLFNNIPDESPLPTPLYWRPKDAVIREKDFNIEYINFLIENIPLCVEHEMRKQRIAEGEIRSYHLVK